MNEDGSLTVTALKEGKTTIIFTKSGYQVLTIDIYVLDTLEISHSGSLYNPVTGGDGSGPVISYPNTKTRVTDSGPVTQTQNTIPDPMAEMSEIRLSGDSGGDATAEPAIAADTPKVHLGNMLAAPFILAAGAGIGSLVFYKKRKQWTGKDFRK